MLPEHLEFSISQYLDGNLPAEESAALEARLNEDAAARQLLDEYRGLNGLLTAEAALPAISWNRLADHISAAVADDAEKTECAISQYCDGTLPTDEIPALEARLNEDPSAR